MDRLIDNIGASIVSFVIGVFLTWLWAMYWNLVLKHGIRQQPVSERSDGTYLEQALN